MKSRLIAILITDTGSWHLAVATGKNIQLQALPTPESKYDADSNIKAIRAIVKKSGLTVQPLVLGVPSQWCMAATISMDGISQRNTRGRFMSFKLEEKLPIAAEDFTADFLINGNRAMGVAVRHNQVCDLVTSLESAILPVSTVSPLSLLAAQQRCANLPQNDDKTNSTLMVLHWRETTDVLSLHGKKPLSWTFTSSHNSSIDQQVHAHQAFHGNGTNVVHIGVTSEQNLKDTHTEHLEEPSERAEQDIILSAANVAFMINAGKTTPWIELRRGALQAHDSLRHIRGPLNAVFTSAAVLLIALIVGCGYRAVRYEAQANVFIQSQETTFRQTLPNQRVPAGIRSRLESEERRLRGLSGENIDLQPPQSALQTLYEALSRLPMTGTSNPKIMRTSAATITRRQMNSPSAESKSELRYRLLEIRIEPDRMLIEGQARTHGDADTLAAALRKQQGFQIDPPRTEQLTDKGISFTLNAIPPHQDGNHDFIANQNATFTDSVPSELQSRQP